MAKKLKVAFLSRYYGVVNRGVESYIDELVPRLRPYYEIDVLTGSDSDNLLKILKGHYDIIIPTNGRLQALKVSLGRLLFGYKMVVAGHAGVGRDDLWNLAMLPDVFVALTQKELGWAKKFALFPKVVKINNGIDLKKFSPSGGKEDLKLQRPVILSVGALEWYKFHDRTIKAVAGLEKGSLLIIGKGSLKDEINKLGLDLLGKERFDLIEVNYKDIPRYYRSCDLFALPSWDREAFGIVYLEALASNLAVVAPDDASRKEIVGEGGILTDTADIKKYTEALRQALSIEWGDGPRRQAEKFSWDKISLEYKELFDGLFK